MPSTSYTSPTADSDTADLRGEPAMTYTLDQSLRDLMEAHDLTAISLCVRKSYTAVGEWFPTCYVHGGGVCASNDHTAPTLALAIVDAIRTLDAKREPYRDLPQLPALEAEAA